MKPFDAVEAALQNCPPFESRSLGDFLGDLLTEDLDALAQLPGSPGQVLAAQFTCYARSSVPLSEALQQQTEPFRTLQDTLGRLSAPSASPAKRRRSARADPSDPQARSGR
ncbi:MAG: hypothetical protein HS116_05760 [Planctomycetes bacterium]|nr:hypothetical protein [Planctomycetota bacterium]